MRRSIALAIPIALAAACSGALPPRAQVVVAIDTDVPVPAFVDRLRVEVYDGAGGVLLDSRDLPLLDATQWPFSFGLRADDAAPGASFRLRIRGYRSARAAASSSGGTPEPDPVTTIDRVVRGSVPTGVTLLQVVLRGACLGVGADVVAGKSCGDTGNGSLQVVSVSPGVPYRGVLPDRVAPWADVGPIRCQGAPRAESGVHDAERCIPGGVFLMGDRSVFGLPCTDHLCDGAPERFASLSPFFLDRYEVSVGRLRAAMQDPTRPFVPPSEPKLNVPNGDPYGLSGTYCTWRGADAPGDAALDALPVNCTSIDTARAFCRWAGGDLPSEAQWEFAAAQSWRYDVFKSKFPWGDDEPSCGCAAYGRFADTSTNECTQASNDYRLGPNFGPLGVDQPFGASCPRGMRDETPDENGEGGIVGMGGNVMEYVRDVRARYSDACWQTAPRRDPECTQSPYPVPHFMARGGGWITNAPDLQAAERTGGTDQIDLGEQVGLLGFRCMRPSGGAAP